MTDRYKRRPVSVCECGDHAFVKSTKGYTPIFDVDDIEKIRPWNWCSMKSGHAKRGKSKAEGGRSIMIHHEIFGRIDGLEVDHIDGNPMNNRKSNLRFVTKAQNQMNRTAIVATSGFKGVCPNKKGWIAKIKKTVNGVCKTFCLGTYPTKEQAAAVYDAAATDLFGVFAKTNKEIHGSATP